MSLRFDVVVVGAGFAGSVIARQLAEAGRKVHLLEKREHIGGNAFDETDASGVLVHRYGPHIFHTNAPRISDYLGRFTTWRKYEHRVLASVDGQLLPMPINRTTINRLYGLTLDEAGVQAFLDSARIPKEHCKTSEDVVLNNVGLDLCEKFFRGYTRKQWGLDLSELKAGVAARIPTRSNDDDRYFTDDFQCMPAEGYTRLFERMLDHPAITVELGQSYEAIRQRSHYNFLVYTGPIDAYFNYVHGKLPYRSLRFEHEHLPDVPQYQSVGTVNFPNDFAYTRITEFKHLTGQQHSGTSVVREYPEADGDPYYPVPTEENEVQFKLYHNLTKDQANVAFVGRLAQYRYYNMDQVVGSALSAAEKILAALTT